MSPSPPLSSALLALLRCPTTRQPLALASAEFLARRQPAVEDALVREDGAVFYPIVQGIPQLRPQDAIPLAPPAGP